jgi:DNA-directed RNA polymerase specialized sigma24 family protein
LADRHLAWRVAQALAERKERALQLADAPDGTDLEAELIERLTLGTALRAISERDRELIALRYGADLPTRQIGNLLGLTDSAVDVGIHRARNRLRAALEQEQRKTDLAASPGTTRPIDVRNRAASVLLEVHAPDRGGSV